MAASRQGENRLEKSFDDSAKEREKPADALGTGTQSLASLAGVKPGIGNTASQAMAPTTTLEVRGLAMLADAGISAGLRTAIEGGSFGSALKTAEVQVAARAVKMPQMRLETPRGSWGKVAKRQSPTLSMAQYRVRRLLSRGSYRRCRSERQPDRGGWSGESE
nr:DUF637 domain-containing protein [Burkholderia multivorans]